MFIVAIGEKNNFVAFSPVQELASTCRQMQQRIVELVARIQNEDVTGM